MPDAITCTLPTTFPTNTPASYAQMVGRGNMFSGNKLRADLADVREQITHAILIAHGRRQLAPGESMWCLKTLRNLEAELIVRLDALGAAGV